jgi:surface antigen
MKQLLNGIAVALCAVGLVGCSNMGMYSSTTTTDTTVTTTKKVAKNQKVDKITDQTAGTMTANATTTDESQVANPVTPTSLSPADTAYESKRIAGSFTSHMEPTDKAQLRGAFENNPVGQTTSWTNDKTGVAYSVTPIKNVTYKGNEYCREYRISNNKGDQKQGIACRRAKGAVWEPVT